MFSPDGFPEVIGNCDPLRVVHELARIDADLGDHEAGDKTALMEARIKLAVLAELLKRTRALIPGPSRN